MIVQMREISLLQLIFSLATSALYIIAGVVGISNANNQEKANYLVGFGVVLLIIAVANLIITLFMYGLIMMLFSCVSIVWPILYMVGAYKNQ